MTTTHCDRLLDWFSRRDSITPIEALNDLGIYRLGARIHDLRERGHSIRTERIEHVNRSGNASRPARYVYLSPPKSHPSAPPLQLDPGQPA
ncbi:MAG: helix-turn-helix domain-containing protein [Pseudomonadota bacterium]|nr:helix-turn-helix domain-containing protein [Pseudomonadota bacterium]